MDFWRFVPTVKRPWNPAYWDIWDRMTHRERQVSFLIDVAIVLAAIAGYLYGRWVYGL